MDWCATFISDTPEYVQGRLYYGTGYKPDPKEQATGWLHAIDGNDGSIRWKKKFDYPVVAGVTPTAGGVVFTGDLGGSFYAFDKATGAELLKLKSDGSIAGGIVTYSVRGKQYVAFTSGNVSRGTFDTQGSPKLVVLALEAPETTFHAVALPEVNGRGLVSLQSPVLRGQQVFASFCATCHGARGEQLVASSDKRTVETLVAFIKNPTGAMPKLHPQPLDEAEVTAVATYVRTVLQASKR